MHASFARTTFERRILGTEEAALLPDEWTPINLFMRDMYGGPTRTVTVHMMTRQDRILLKSIDQLKKAEFEMLFGFGCDRFEAGRVIEVEKDVLCLFKF